VDLLVRVREVYPRPRRLDQSRRIVHNLGVEGRAPAATVAQVVHMLLEEEVKVLGYRIHVSIRHTKRID
jgi:hypothetical protein